MRKTKTVVISADNRDKGKTFLLTEMPSDKSERWALRVLNIILASGLEIPDSIAAAGLAGVAELLTTTLSSFRGLDWDKVEPLLDEMMACVQIVPAPSRPEIVRALIPEDIEEISTRLLLRKEVVTLHVDFSALGGM